MNYIDEAPAEAGCGRPARRHGLASNPVNGIPTTYDE